VGGVYYIGDIPDGDFCYPAGTGIYKMIWDIDVRTVRHIDN